MILSWNSKHPSAVNSFYCFRGSCFESLWGFLFLLRHTGVESGPVLLVNTTLILCGLVGLPPVKYRLHELSNSVLAVSTENRSCAWSYLGHICTILRSESTQKQHWQSQSLKCMVLCLFPDLLLCPNYRIQTSK